MRRHQRLHGLAQRRRDVAAHAASVLVVAPQVARVARPSVPGRRVIVDCAGTRVSAFSPAGRGRFCVAWTRATVSFEMGRLR